MSICRKEPEVLSALLNSINMYLFFNPGTSLDSNENVGTFEAGIIFEMELANPEYSVTEFNLKNYLTETSKNFKENLLAIFDTHGVKVPPILIGEANTSIMKTNIASNFETHDIIDKFHTLPMVKLGFDNYLNSLLSKTTFIGSKNAETFVFDDETVTNNLNDLKTSIFEEIQDFLINRNLLDSKQPLYNDDGSVRNYSHYVSVMQKLDNYFFNDNNFTILQSYTQDTNVPNIEGESSKANEEIRQAYYNGIILNNFDLVISSSDLIDVNYNQFNNLWTNPDQIKYKRKFQGLKTPYWLKEEHATEGVENSETRLLDLIVKSIPEYNGKKELTGGLMETKDFYLMAAKIHDFELRHGNRLKNGADPNFKYFNENSKEALEWYLDSIVTNPDAEINKEISEYFKDIFSKFYSIKMFFDSPEFNIRTKEANSEESVIQVLAQALENSYGAVYGISMSNGNYKIKNAYDQDFSSTRVHDRLFNKLFNNSERELYNEKKDTKKLEDIISKLTPLNKNADLVANLGRLSINAKAQLGNFLGYKTGIYLNHLGIDDLIIDIAQGKTLNQTQLLNEFLNLFSALRTDFNNVKKHVEDNVINKISIGDSSSSDYLENTLKNNVYKAMTKVSILNEVVKPIMNISTLTGESIPTFKMANLIYKDTEIFERQRQSEQKNKDKHLFRSLLIQDGSPIRGTSTQLELVNKDYNKSAARFNIKESFTSDFQLGFLQNLTQNSAEKKNVFEVLLGNYSDKNSITKKIIDANFAINGEIVVQMDFPVLLDLIRSQSYNYYKDLTQKLIEDYSVVFKKELDQMGVTLKSVSDTDVLNSLTIINQILANVKDITDYSEIASKAGIQFTTELHYSKYEGKFSVNRLISDNFNIFSSTELFNEFVEKQEKQFIEKYTKFFKDFNNTDETQIPKINFLNNIDLTSVLKILNLTEADFEGVPGMGFDVYANIVTTTGKLNPLLKKWMWINAMYRNEYMYLTGKGEYMHKAKGLKYNTDLYTVNFDSYLVESSERLKSMAKRNVIFNSTIDIPVRKTRFGVPEDVNIAVIEDFVSELYNISGDAPTQEVHDGSSFINYLYSKMVDNSYPGKGYSGTKKPFGTFITDFGVTIKKDAESVITNAKMLYSNNSEISYKDLHRRMLSIPLGDLLLDYDVEFNLDDYFYIKNGETFKLNKITIENGILSLYQDIQTEEGYWKSNNIDYNNISTLYDIWDLIGAEYTMDQNGNFNEGSNELLYKIVTSPSKNSEFKLKDSLIHIISNHSAIKAGGVNVNSKNLWTDKITDSNFRPLSYTTFENRFMGPQLDAGHEADASEIKEITQVISSLAQNASTSELAQEAYNDIANIIKKAMKPYQRYINIKEDRSKINSEELYDYIAKRFVDTVTKTKGDNIAKVLVHAFKDDVRIPFSNQNFYISFVRDIITKMNNEFITRYYSGIGAVLIPSHGIIQIYEDAFGNTYTQQDITKKALQAYKNKGFTLNFEDGEGNIITPTNEQIVDAYKRNLLKNIDITLDEVNVGDTILWFGTEYKLNSPKEYYEFLRNYNEALNDSNAETVINTYYSDIASIQKVYSRSRDLKPSELKFTLESGESRNQYDLDSVKLLFKLNALLDTKDFTNLSDTDYASLNDFEYSALKQFAEYVIPNISLEEALWNSSNRQEYVNLLRYYLGRWTNLSLNLLNENLALRSFTETDTFEEFFKGIDLTESFKNNRSAITQTLNVIDYKLNKAEIIMNNLNKSVFNIDDNISMSEILENKEDYFKEKLNKDYAEDNTNADLKINLLNHDRPIYIKFVEGKELPGIDRSINIKASKDLTDDGVITTFNRYNHEGKLVYTLPDNARVRNEGGKEVIYIKGYDQLSKIGIRISPNLYSDSDNLLASMKNNVINVVPLLKNTTDRDLIQNSMEIFKKYTNYKITDKNFDSDWFIRNKDDIINQLSSRMYANWEKTREVIAARIPAQSMQSFMEMNQVAYLNDNSNDAYVSVWQIWLQGSDFDIDKAYILSSGFGGGGTMDLWTNISDYSSINQLNELEKFAMPTGKEISINPAGVDVTNEYKIFESFMVLNDSILPSELPTEILKVMNSAIRKANSSDSGVAIKGENIPQIANKFIDLINKHNKYNNYTKSKYAINNSVISRIKSIISNPSSQILANSPVQVKVWHDAVNKILNKKGLTEQSEILSPYDMLSMFKQQNDAIVGKEDVGIAANGLKVFFALTSYYNNYYNNNFEKTDTEVRRSNKTFSKTISYINADGEFKTYTLGSISDINISTEQQKVLVNLLGQLDFWNSEAALHLSSFTSAATDNAKELLMAKINATPELASMHIYLMIMGFTPEQIVDIMTSGPMQEIIDRMQVNMLEPGSKSPYIIMLFEKLKRNLTSKGFKEDSPEYQTIESLSSIYQGAQEVKYLASILKVNQKTAANTEELHKFLNQFNNIFLARENLLFGKDLVNIKYWQENKSSKDPKIWEKAQKHFNEFIDVLMEHNTHLNPDIDRQYVEDIIKKASAVEVEYINEFGEIVPKIVSLVGGSFDYRYYMLNVNEDYKKIATDYYNLLKDTYNVLDVIQEVPHFKQMIEGLNLSHTLLTMSSAKYGAVHTILPDILKNSYQRIQYKTGEDKAGITQYMGNPAFMPIIKDRNINKFLIGIDMKLKSNWLKTDAVSHLAFDVDELMRQANNILPEDEKIEDYIYYTSDEAANFNQTKNINKEASNDHIKIINPTRRTKNSEKNIITLNTNHGIANFKRLMEFILLPIVKGASNELSESLRIRSVNNILGIRGNSIESSFPLGDISNPANVARSKKLLKAFNDLDNIPKKYTITNVNGQKLKWRDLFFVYNLLVNNERYGNLRLTPLFQDYLKETTSLGFDYIRYTSKLDSGELKLFDLDAEVLSHPLNGTGTNLDIIENTVKTEMENDILFYAFQEKGKLALRGPRNETKVLQVSNPDFVVVTSLSESVEIKQQWKDLHEIKRLLKSNGFIIQIEC